jgi:hypothetical protein
MTTAVAEKMRGRLLSVEASRKVNLRGELPTLSSPGANKNSRAIGDLNLPHGTLEIFLMKN